MEIEKLVRDNIIEMSPYSTARDEAEKSLGIYLDANENPFETDYNRYPDPQQRNLKEVISRIKGVGINNIFLGNGSDEAIDLLFRIFCVPGIDNVVSISPTYGMYGVASRVNNVDFREVQLNSDFLIDTNKLLKRSDDKTKLLFICSPNNPTGNSFEKEDIVYLVNQFRGIVVIDEAYIDFSDKASVLELIERYDNLVVLQTLSKAYGLAGLRVGIAFSTEKIISLFNKVKYPYNLNTVSQKVAIQALSKGVDSQLAIIKQERDFLKEQLLKIGVIKTVYPSDTNFLLVEVKDASKTYDMLIKRGIVVRNRTNLKGCEGCLRVTIGTPKENRELIKILKSR